MSQTPDEIRSDIERTRGELGADVDALAEKVSPSSIVHRQKTKVRRSLHQVKEAVMGSTEQAGNDARASSHEVGVALQKAPDRLASQTRGNPVAAGLIAFGLGLLASSLIPPSEKEKELAASLKDKAEPLIDSVSEAAKDVAEQMKTPVQEAVQSMKEAATDSVETVKSDAASAAEDVKDRAQGATDGLRG